MGYLFRIYYSTKDSLAIKRIKQKFNTCVSVNYESVIKTDEEGKALLEETERRGFIQIREVKTI